MFLVTRRSNDHNSNLLAIIFLVAVDTDRARTYGAHPPSSPLFQNHLRLLVFFLGGWGLIYIDRTIAVIYALVFLIGTIVGQETPSTRGRSRCARGLPLPALCQRKGADTRCATTLSEYPMTLAMPYPRIDLTRYGGGEGEIVSFCCFSCRRWGTTRLGFPESASA